MIKLYVLEINQKFQFKVFALDTSQLIINFSDTIRGLIDNNTVNLKIGSRSKWSLLTFMSHFLSV